MTTADIINAFVAFGTIALAFIAIFQDSLRSYFAGPRLRLVHRNPKGVPVRINGRWTVFHLLTIVNDRSSVTATNCRVQVKRIERQAPDGTFVEVTLLFPLLMYWSPSEITPPFLSVRHEQLVDFGFLREGQPFHPYSRLYPSNFDGDLRPGQRMRYWFEVVSDNFASPRLQGFEVSWDGKWTEDLDQLAQHLQIREVPSTMPNC
jgi:hypothetical protein